jgi:hypothetical protein
MTPDEVAQVRATERAFIAERALADDLSEVLYRYLTDFTQHPDVQQVMARYREARR